VILRPLFSGIAASLVTFIGVFESATAGDASLTRVPVMEFLPVSRSAGGASARSFLAGGMEWFEGRGPAWTAAEVTSARTSRGGTVLRLTLVDAAALRLRESLPDSGTREVAILLDGRVVRVARVGVEESDGSHVTLTGLDAGQGDRLAAWLSRSGVAFDAPILSVRGRSASARPGELVRVDAWVENADDLAAYEVSVRVTGGDRGTIAVEDVSVAADHDDYLFRGTTPISITDERRAAGALLNGSAGATDPAYLATFSLRVSDDAAGTFQIAVDDGERSLLRDAQALEVVYRTAAPLAIEVGPGPKPVRVFGR